MPKGLIINLRAFASSREQGDRPLRGESMQDAGTDPFAGKVQLVLMDCSTEVAASLASAAFVSGMRISPPLPSRRRGAE